MTLGLKAADAKQAAKGSALILSTGGVGAIMGVWFSNVLRDRPELLVQLLTSFGPMFVIVVGMMYLIDKHGGRIVEAQKENAIATQRMATAIEVIAKRDDERERELELLLGSLARDTQQVLGRLGRIEERLSEPRANAHYAG